MTFTPQTPTEPGDFRWKAQSFQTDYSLIRIIKWRGGLRVDRRSSSSIVSPKDLGGLWCRLVPADEVKEAWAEGRASVWTDKNGELLEMWNNSRAKRITEGVE